MTEAPANVEEFLAGANEEAAGLFRRLQEPVEGCGPSELAVRRTIVYWRQAEAYDHVGPGAR
jgi:hypothetical protein